MTYAKLNGGTLEYLPRILTTPNGQIINPTEEEIQDAGFKPVVDEPPKTAPNEIATRTGWVETEKEIKAVYKITVQPKQPRVFSKFEVVKRAIDRGVWNQIWELITKSGLEPLYSACNEFREDDPYFESMLIRCKTELGFTAEQIEAVLSESVVNPV